MSNACRSYSIVYNIAVHVRYIHINSICNQNFYAATDAFIQMKFRDIYIRKVVYEMIYHCLKGLNLCKKHSFFIKIIHPRPFMHFIGFQDV